jgi:zinc D-Ala-D-Ala carboxypeptidase
MASMQSRRPAAVSLLPPRAARPRRAVRVVATVGALVCLAGCSLRATADGAAPSAVTVSTEPTAPASTGIDPELQRRFDIAQAAAAKRGLKLTITSGRRTVQQQEDLINQAVAEHGSVAEAHKWVLPPERSAHVAGTAIDVADQKAAAWLDDHEVEYGLCRTYANEWWHFELVGPVGAQCPAMHPDSSSGWDGVDGR